MHEMKSCVQGYHIYKDIWAATIREDLSCETELLNHVDRYAVAALKDDTTICKGIAPDRLPIGSGNPSLPQGFRYFNNDTIHMC